VKKLLAILAFCLLMVRPGVAEERGDFWYAAEGADGEIKGQWIFKIEDGKISGSANMFRGGGENLTYNVSGVVGEADKVELERASSSDGVACSYRGTREDDRTISGSFECDGRTGPWYLQRVAKDEEVVELSAPDPSPFRRRPAP